MSVPSCLLLLPSHSPRTAPSEACELSSPPHVSPTSRCLLMHRLLCLHAASLVISPSSEITAFCWFYKVLL